MRISRLTAILSFIIISCGSNQQAATEKETTPGEVKHAHGAETSGLELNNGAKWKADSSTNSNVKDLQTTVDRFNNGTDRSMNAYMTTSTGLDAGLNKLISECKMKGPDHDALHKWLEPFIVEVASLKSATTEQKAGDVLKEIQKRLHLYTQYFE